MISLLQDGKVACVFQSDVFVQSFGLQVASVMGLMSVALDLLLLIHPMSNAQDELKEMSSSRQDLKNDMQELEAAGFLKPCKETPDSWDFAQVTHLRELVHEQMHWRMSVGKCIRNHEFLTIVASKIEQPSMGQVLCAWD